MSSCCSFRCFCDWVVGLILNFTFLGAIIVGVVRFEAMWPLALIVSLVYPIILFLWIRNYPTEPQAAGMIAGEKVGDDEKDGIEKTDGDEEQTPPQEEDANAEQKPSEDEGTEPETPEALDNQDITPNSNSASPGKISVGLAMLYGLFSLSIGVPGAILGHLVLPCEDNTRGYNSNQKWATNYSLIPPDVQDWDQIHSEPNVCRSGPCNGFRATFVTINGHFYFSGTSETDGQVHLMTVPLNSDASITTPSPVGHVLNPFYLAAVGDEYLCFGSTPYDYWDDAVDVGCGVQGEDGNIENLRYLPRGENKDKHYVRYYNLIGIDGKLWFQKTDDIHEGHAVASVDPATMSLTIYSELYSPRNEGDRTHDERNYEIREGLSSQDCNDREESTSGVACLFFLSAIPVVLVSGWLWIKKGIPSSSITLFIGIGLVCASFVGFSDPWDLFPSFGLYCIVVAPIWVVVCTYILAVGKRVARAPLLWSVHFLNFCFFVAIVITIFNIDMDLGYEIIDGDGDDYYIHPWWLIFFGVTFIFVPLGVMGIILDSSFIFFESLIPAVVSVASGVAYSLRKTPLHAILAGAAFVAVLMAVGGVYLYCIRRRIRLFLLNRLTRCTHHLCGGAHDGAEEEEGATESLLLREEGETQAQEEGNQAGRATGEMA